MIALIDGDALVYLAGHAVQRTFYRARHKDTGELLKTYPVGMTKTEIKKLTDNPKDCILKECKEVEPEHYAFHIVKVKLQTILGNTKADEYQIYLTSSDKSNFRYEVAKTLPYKAGRTTRPKHYDAIREYLVKWYDAKVIHNCEADDMLVKRHKLYNKMGKDAIICSNDKDMLQSPGLHYIIRDEKIVKVSEEVAKLNLIFQIIYGDTSDNIPGLKYLFKPRIGEVKIKKWIRDQKKLFLSDSLTVASERSMPLWLYRFWQCSGFFRDDIQDFNQVMDLYEEQKLLVTCGDI